MHKKCVSVNDLNVLSLFHLVLNLYFVSCFMLKLCTAVVLGQVSLVKEILISMRLTWLIKDIILLLLIIIQVPEILKLSQLNTVVTEV